MDDAAFQSDLRKPNLRQAIQAVMDQYPLLGIHGFMPDRGAGHAFVIEWPELGSEEFNHLRQAMLSEDALVQFEQCCSFLDKVERTPEVNFECYSSFGLKNLIEEWADTCILNGIAIAAAVHKGFLIQQHDNGASPNAAFNMSKASLEEIIGDRL